LTARQDGFVFEIGPTLRETRVRKRLTLQQVEEDIKIRSRYLQALEEEEFDILPAPAYAKGFLHSYATYLGLDPRVFIDEFNSRYVEPEPQEQLAGPSALRRPAHTHRKMGLVFFAIVAILVLASIYLLGLGGGSDEDVPKVNTSALSPTPSTSPQVTPTTSPTGGATPVAGASTVVIEAATASCYLEIFSGSLQKAAIFADTLAQGERKTYRPKGKLFVRVGGDPAALAIWLNDSKVPSGSDESGVVYVFDKGQVTRQ
jgi:transcriptional regulator with XRE-family HTH domain